MIEYIEKFDHYLLKCGVREDPSVTLSRFKNRLQPYIKRELFMREVTALEHAYQIVQDVEKFSRFPEPTPSQPVDTRTMGSKPNFTPPVKGPFQVQLYPRGLINHHPLQPYIKRELFMREVTTLEHAYQIARDAEKFSRFPKPTSS